MYYNQELGLCIEFGPVRVDSVRRGGAPPESNPPCAGSRRHGLLPGLLVIACYLSFTPSSLKSFLAVRAGVLLLLGCVLMAEDWSRLECDQVFEQVSSNRQVLY